MKNEILDDIPKNDFHSQLEPNEKIIWEGRSSLNWLSLIIQLIAINLISIGFLIIDSDISSTDIPTYAIFIFLLSLLVIVFSQLKILKIKFLLSDKKIHFRFMEQKKDHFITIPFEKIEGISVKRNTINFDYGNITLYIGEDESKFYLQELSGSPNLVLDSIYHIKEVEKYLNLGIEKKL